MTPAAAPEPRAAEAIGRLAAKLVRHARAAHEGADDAVHDLRVACRRIETWMRLWSWRGDARTVRAAVRGVRRAVGAVRDDEVVAALLTSGQLGAGAIPKSVRAAWCAQLASRRTRQRLPAPARIARVARTAVQWAKLLGEAPGRAGRAARRTQRWESRARSRLAAALLDGGPGALHAARLAVKRWRYAAEAAGVAGAQAEAEARHWQKALGALNDRATLASFVARQGVVGQSHALRLEALRRAALQRLRRRHAARVVRPRARPPQG